jgi:hypothetical protein
MSKIIYPVVLCLLILSGCIYGSSGENSKTTDQAVDDFSTPEKVETQDLEQRSKTALIDFHQSLNQGQYDQAAALYGGSYEILQGYNPEMDPSGREELLQSACTMNGFICLPIHEANLVSTSIPGDYVYEVTFKNSDGTTFELGPCCGASEEIMPVVSIFTVHVVCDPGDVCRVMDLPPYVP